MTLLKTGNGWDYVVSGVIGAFSKYLEIII